MDREEQGTYRRNIDPYHGAVEEYKPGNYVRGDGITTCRECGIPLEQFREGCPTCILREIETGQTEDIPFHNEACANCGIPRDLHLEPSDPIRTTLHSTWGCLNRCRHFIRCSPPRAAYGTLEEGVQPDLIKDKEPTCYSDYGLSYEILESSLLSLLQAIRSADPQLKTHSVSIQYETAVVGKVTYTISVTRGDI